VANKSHQHVIFNCYIQLTGFKILKTITDPGIPLFI